KLPFHRVSGKGVVFHLIAFQVVENIAFELLVILAAHIPRSEGGNLARVLEGAFRIDMRKRGGVRRRGFGRRWRRRGLLGFRGCAGGGGGSLGASHSVRQGDGQRQGQANP